jgi:hypothetical protein
VTDLAAFGIPLVISGLARCKNLPKPSLLGGVFSCGLFCVLEMGIEGFMFSSFLLVLDFDVDCGRGFVTLLVEFGVHELMFSGSAVAGVLLVLRLRRRRGDGDGGNGAERWRRPCVVSIDFLCTLYQLVRLIFYF